MYRRSLIFVVISVLVVALVYSSFTPFIASAVPPSHPDTASCSNTSGTLTQYTCCWYEEVSPETGNPGLGGNHEQYCQECTLLFRGGQEVWECDDPELQFLVGTTPGLGVLPGDTGVLEPQPSPPPLGPAAPLQGGVLEQLEQGGGAAPGFAPGFLQQQEQLSPAEQGAAELPPPPPATEGSQPATVEEDQPVPVCQEGLEFNEDLGFCVPTECPEGQELNEETGICVLEEEEQPAAAEEPQEQQAAQQQEEEQPSEGSGSEEDNGNN